MHRKTLEQLYAEHHGKVSDKWSLYLIEYDRLLSEYREKPISFLEIGIQNGGSLEIWAKYFGNATALVGCDINPNCERLTYDDPRIGVIVGDANVQAIQELVLKISPQFDIIIDDGSHLSSDIVKSFAQYFPRVSEGGIFIAEDMHCSYWSQFEGGLFDPYSSISFFKRLADISNYEHWNSPKARVDILKGIFSKYECELDEKTLSQVHSVEFINSMCVVRKAPEVNISIGRRVIVGSIELVTQSIKDKIPNPDPILDQSNNPWTARVVPPDEAIQQVELALDNIKQQHAALAQQHAALEQQHAALEQQHANSNQEITELRRSASWRLTAPLRFLGSITKKLVGGTQATKD